MISGLVSCKKVRRNGKFLLFGALLMVVVLAVYHQMLFLNVWSSSTNQILHTNASSWLRANIDEKVKQNYQIDALEESASWKSSFIPQAWKPEHKGGANLHAFDDWCGSSTADLFRNIHYPLFPHVRTTVQKLSVSPQWTNYGLRIFGYLHPYADGDYVFAVSSDDNSEFWLSTDDSPFNVKLLAWVGRTGAEWTAPGEFDKYINQTSRQVGLSAQRKYFFEVIHQQNHEGTDHVEVAWRRLDQDVKFQVIESKHISLYVDESPFLPGDVAHIPQTVASHKRTLTKQHSGAADMLREDPRDTFHRVPLINSKFLQGVLPKCLYKPSYTIKGIPLSRYQGLHFARCSDFLELPCNPMVKMRLQDVTARGRNSPSQNHFKVWTVDWTKQACKGVRELVYMSYIYPDDHTRLTHMETQTSCFYPDSSQGSKRFRSPAYMTLGSSVNKNKGYTGEDFGARTQKNVLDGEGMFNIGDHRRGDTNGRDFIDRGLFLDYGDDYDDYVQKRKLLSILTPKNSSDSKLHILESQRRRGRSGALQPRSKLRKSVKPLQSVPTRASKTHPHLQQNQTERWVKGVEQIKPKQKLRSQKRQKPKSVETAVRAGQTNKKTSLPAETEQLKAKKRPGVPSEQLSSKQYHIKNLTQIQTPKDSKPQPKERDVPLLEKPTVASQRSFKTKDEHLTTLKRDYSLVRLNQRETDGRKHLRDKEIEMNMPLQEDQDQSIDTVKIITGEETDTNQADTIQKEDHAWEEYDMHFNDVNSRDTREDDENSMWEAEHFESPGDTEFDPDSKWSQTFQFSHQELHAQRSDKINFNCNISGNLLIQSSEVLPLVKAFMDQLNEKHSGQFKLVRVMNVVKRVDKVKGNRYLLELEVEDVNGQLLRLSHYIYALSSQRMKEPPTHPELMLCNPVGFQWNPAATVHFIVAVKNQARWVHQLIDDMERLYKETQDTNFNLIITDYSTDMDVKKALQKSSVHRYEYVKLSGNFERSAGLQAGVNLIKDPHSIVFLFDLHIHFPSFIIDAIRKSCVEGHMAFAPVVMRLNCGATPSDAKGYWEINGFGLLGIYKSDLDAIGGMNTREYKDRWGGEDWELLDRILVAGLEVERVYLRNFFHYFHSHRGMWNNR